MQALLISFLAVFTAEMGDKTQLIALCLASRFKKPVPVIAAIFAATVANHLAAGLAGHWLGALLTGKVLHVLLGLSFLAAAAWAFIPDKIDEVQCETGGRSIFMVSFVTFFLAEIGDKTQLATVALGAQFPSLVSVVAGTTLGMMAANVPAVLLSNAVSSRVSLVLVRALSGILFAGLGLYELSKLWHG